MDLGELKELLDYGRNPFAIPDRMMPALERYINNGEIPGDFLQAVICNDLKEAVARADGENLRNLPAYIMYLYNDAPGACWGSRDKMEAWAEALMEEG